MDKTVAVIDGKSYQVGYPLCSGCEHLCFPAPLRCLYEGDGCEWPAWRKAKEPIDTGEKKE